MRCDELFGELWKHRLGRRGAGPPGPGPRYTWLEQGVMDPSIPGPWVAETPPTASKQENVHRHIG